jgi:phage tail sheath protein FI
VVSAITQAARWAVFEKPDPVLAARIRAQISHYFAGLAEVGAFADERYVVECDVGLPEGQDAVPRAVTIVLVFHPVGCDDPVSLKLNVTAAGCRVSTTAFAPTMAGSAGDSSQPD